MPLMKRLLSFFHKKDSDNGHLSSILLRMTASYSLFLLIALILVLMLLNARVNQNKNNYWNQNSLIFQSCSNLLDSNLSVIDSFTSELILNDSFVRLARYTDTDNSMYYLTASNVKDNLSAQLFTLEYLPVKGYYIYLRNTNYVLSLNTFEEEDLFFSGKRSYMQESFDEWRTLMNDTSDTSKLLLMEHYRLDESRPLYMYIFNMDAISYRRLPATICFELDTVNIAEMFSPIPLGGTGNVLISNPAQDSLMQLHTSPDMSDLTAQSLTGLSYVNNQASLVRPDGTRIHVTRYFSSVTDWTYYLLQPESLAVAGNDVRLFYFVLLPLIAILGCAIVFVIVMKNMKPVELLDSQLQEAITDREQLQVEIEEQKPLLYDIYVRRLLLGQVTAPDELSYIRDFLHYDGEGLRFTALYTIVYSNGDDSEAGTDRSDNADVSLVELVSQKLSEYLKPEFPSYVFVTSDQAYAVLVAYDGSDSDYLMHLQEKILRLHNDLLEQRGIWLYSGIGRSCSSLQHVWESYQQAIDAINYSGKNYIFLPYEMIRKDSNVFYYPAELSNRLVHFISSGNRSQVQELLNLIHEENIEQRSLPLNLLKYLLSDIRNTLLRARFAIHTENPEMQARLQALDKRFDEHLSFKLCEDIALELCGITVVKQETGGLIGTIETYIRENFRDPSMCLSKISEEFNISETYFSHLFKEKTNSNFSVYLEDLRLEEARRRIQAKDCKLSDLYLEVGYNNVNSFRRAFKKKYGVPPSAIS